VVPESHLSMTLIQGTSRKTEFARRDRVENAVLRVGKSVHEWSGCTCDASRRSLSFHRLSQTPCATWDRCCVGALLLGHQGPVGRNVSRQHRVRFVSSSLPKRLIRLSRMRTRSPECNVRRINGGSASAYGLGGGTHSGGTAACSLGGGSPVAILRAGDTIARTVASLPATCRAPSRLVNDARPARPPGIWLEACEMRSTVDSSR
jgi:hypothetical protein